jgi:hypothetical protein
MQLPGQRISQPGSRRRHRVAFVATALSLCVAVGGCGPGPSRKAGGGELLAVGARRAAPTPARLRTGTDLAHRAARIYAAGAYSRRPPTLPRESGEVASELSAAARRVPPARRRRDPGLRGLVLHPIGVGRIVATALIGDGVSPLFTVGIELRWRGGWRVVAISLPD